MRLSNIYNYQKERFPELEIGIASRVEDGKELIHVEHKVILGVDFNLDDVNSDTILEDIANTVRNGLYQLIIKSQIEQPQEEPTEVETDEAVEETIVEDVADEDRKVIL
jgi:hypothetical protein